MTLTLRIESREKRQGGRGYRGSGSERAVVEAVQVGRDQAARGPGAVRTSSSTDRLLGQRQIRPRDSRQRSKVHDRDR